ncbi:hypothetical protein A4A49_06054 [Nicotiana attenuata]|uniref:Uncharacterized protein n=1 Tax=Nicotiana attenuata TaxID=49451 RepID=A0A314L1K3_NICAT|nr:hypothetical protein A4A49_06054 [Nicotiana attenuata]
MILVSNDVMVVWTVMCYEIRDDYAPEHLKIFILVSTRNGIWPMLSSNHVYSSMHLFGVVGCLLISLMHYLNNSVIVKFFISLLQCSF